MSASSYIATHGLDPIPMSALTPSAKETATAPSDPAVQADGAAQAATDEDGFTFWDLLDIINPLQHIPGVSSVYREVTGDKIGEVARLAGATLFGGPIGLALAGADYVLKETTGGHLDEHAVAMINGTNVDGSPYEQGESQLAATQQYYSGDTGESSSNMLAYANSTTPWQMDEAVQGSGNSQLASASPVPAAASSSATVASAATADSAVVADTVAMAAPTAAPAPTPAATTPAATHAMGSVRGDGHAFALDRNRDVRSPSLAVEPPRVDAYAQINGRQTRKAAVEVVSPAVSDAPIPLGMAAESLSQPALPLAAQTASAKDMQPTPQALSNALQAQGLQPTGSMPLGLFDPQGSQAAPTPTPATAPQPQAAAGDQQAAVPAQQAAGGPVLVPAWFDQAMQKAVANYERTGSLAGAPAAVPVQTKGTSS
jgi:hypothetical protein